MADPNSPAVQQWAGLVGQYTDWNPQVMLLAIAQESGGSPSANNGNHFGLFQSTNPAALDNPQAAVQIAHQQYLDSKAAFPAGQGYAPWGYNNSYQGQPFGALGITYPNQVTALLNGQGGGGSRPVSYSPAAQIAPYQNDQQRYDFLLQQQQNGGRLGPDALAFLNSYGQAAPSAPVNPNLVAPGSQYQSDQQRYDYLQNLVSRGVAIAPEAQNFLNTYQGQTASQSNASALGEVLPQLQNEIPPAPAPAVPMDPYGYQPSGGVYGNQTTTNNMAAQNAYQDVLGYQQAATAPQSGGGITGFDPNSGAYQATVYSDSGVGTNIGGYAGDPNNAPGGSDPGIEASFGGGGTVTVGSSGKAKIAPTLAIGAPFNPETIGTFPALGKGGNLDAPEPVIFVGKYTGIPYAEAGEVPGERENITVTPIDGPDRNDNPVGPAPVEMPHQINPVGDSMPVNTGPSEMHYSGGGFATVGEPPPPETYPGNAYWGDVTEPTLAQAPPYVGAQIPNWPLTADLTWQQYQNEAERERSGFGPVVDNELQSAGRLAQIGVSPMLLDMVPPENVALTKNVPEGTGGGYYPGDNRIKLAPYDIPPGLIHENLHSFENWYSPGPPPNWQQIVQNNPPPDEYNSWHPGGITGYFDANAGNGYPVPQEVIDYLNSRLPAGPSRYEGLLGGRRLPTPASDEMAHYAEGGDATVGSPVFSQYGDPNARKLQDQQNLLNSRLASIGPSQNYLNAQGNVYQSQANNFPNQQNYLNAQGNVYQAQQGTFGPQQAYIGAQGDVINAQGQQTQGERAYIGQAMGNNQQTQQEEAAYQAAERNIPDLNATGQAKSYEDSTDYLYRMAGVVPGEVDTRGGKLPEGSPVNVRAKIQSQADILKANNADSQRTRELQLQGAKLAVDLLGTNVDAARQAAARVGLTVDQAKLMVQEAENQASFAGLAVKQGDLETDKYRNQAGIAGLGRQQADLNTEQLSYQNQLSELPPQAGLTVYTNPFTGASEYMTPAQARIQEQADNIALKAQAPAGGQQSFSRSTIQSLVSKGLITDDDAFAQLTAMGYTPAQAQQLISAAKPRGRTSGSQVPSWQKINDDIFGGPMDPFGLGTGSVILPNNDIKIGAKSGSGGGSSGGGYTSAFQ